MTKVPPTGVPSGTSAAKWWVVYTTVSQSIHPAPNPQGTTSFIIVAAPNSGVAKSDATKRGMIVTKVAGPYATKPDAQKAAAGVSAHNKAAATAAENRPIPTILNPASWLSGLGGLIGSGIESGIVSMLKDLWDVIVGPVEILIGSLLAIFVLAIYFRDDIGGIMGTVAMAAA